MDGFYRVAGLVGVVRNLKSLQRLLMRIMIYFDMTVFVNSWVLFF